MTAHDCLLAEIRMELIEEARLELAEAMLARICTFGGDVAFQTINARLARDLGCSHIEAGRLLHPVVRRVYRAAQAAAGVAHG